MVNGGASITPTLARRLLRRLEHVQGETRHGSTATRRGPVADDAGYLTEREREVLRMVANGYTSSEIGTRLGISVQTVNAHIKNIYHKLQVHSRAQAVNQASIRGWLY